MWKSCLKDKYSIWVFWLGISAYDKKQLRMDLPERKLLLKQKQNCSKKIMLYAIFSQKKKPAKNQAQLLNVIASPK